MCFAFAVRCAAGRIIPLLAGGVGGVLLSLGAKAQTPPRPITLVVPFTAGGPTDKLARDLVQALRKQVGPIVVENVAGVGGTLGALRVAKAAPDGRTLLLHHIGMATAPAMFHTLPFRPLEDFEYLGLINEVPMTVIGRPSLPANTYPELVRWLHANRSKANLATAGQGSASQLCGVLLLQHLKLELATVAYKGTAPAMADLLAGQVDVMCDQTTNTSGQIERGRVKAFAVTSPRRLESAWLARLPTLDEAGLRGFNVTIWHGLYAPKGTPRPVVERLNAALRSALADPTFQQREVALGAVVVTDARLTPAGHRQFVQAEMNKWGPAIKATGQFAD